MDKQRIQAYLELIQLLLDCPQGREAEILQAHQELLDAGLVEIMQQYAAYLGSQGDGNRARWLLGMAEQLVEALGIGDAGANGLPEDSEQFLWYLLPLVADSNGDAQQVYPFLAQHQERLNESLLQTLPKVAARLLMGDSDQQQLIAAVLVEFGNLIQQFPLGRRWLNLELGISAYQLALQVVTREAFPENWAVAESNLANVYNARIRGDRADNLEQAINAAKLALQVLTREAFPEQWATTQNDLANAYSDRIRGDRANNLEQAIATYQLALQVLTREAFPTHWAMTQNNLAIAYSDRIRGDRANNLEQAIATYQLALQVYTRQAFPEDWAMTQNNLAMAYIARIQGHRADNLEQAIMAAELALQVYTYEAFPEKWAVTQNNLAGAYRKRIKGDRADNLEQAIASAKLALQVYTHEAFPEKWAMTQHNLAAAYRNRILGNRADNLEQAIAAYNLALQVYTCEAFPEQWATTQNDLANAYRNRIRGDRADNLEQAIASAKLALGVYPDKAFPEPFPEQWAQTQNNLANAYRERIKGNPDDNLEQAIAAAKLALHHVYKLQVFPEQWAMMQNNLANAYSKRIRGNRDDNLKQAIAAYELALQVRTFETLPKDCLETARNLGNFHFQQQTWAEAASAYTKALQAGEILYQSAIMLDGKAAELAETNHLPRLAAYALARIGNLEAAALTLEQGRARGLRETLDRDRANLTELQQTHSDLFTQYQDITNQLRNLEGQERLRMTSEDRHSLTPEYLRTTAQSLRQNLTATIDDIRKVTDYEDFLAQPTFDDIGEALRPDIPLVYLVPTPAGSLALIVTKEGIADLWFDDFTGNSQEKLFINWLTAYGDHKQKQQKWAQVKNIHSVWQEFQTNPTNKEKERAWLEIQKNHPVWQEVEKSRLAWLKAIDQGTRQLWQPLMAPLINHLKQRNFQQATLIPTGFLNFLPLHAAWTEDANTPTGRLYALDAIHFTYAPNARSLVTAEEIAQRTLTLADSILAIDNPLGDLPNSTREVTAAVASFPKRKVLQHQQATIESVLAALPHYNILHLLCHGTANLREPLTSGLAMSDGLLTLRDFLDLKLDGIRLAILSACETGLAGTDLADEVISLPTGLLQAGVAGVAASLWSVSDLSTMMLLTRFYVLWRTENLEIDQALSQAQKWVRDSTNGEKADYFKALITQVAQVKIPADIASFLYKSVILSNPKARDFAHPFHWAAFQYVGV